MQELDRLGVGYVYEKERVPYHKLHHYTPDFFLANGVIVEYKGYFKSSDRSKHLLVKQEHPELDIRFVFERDLTLSKKSSTRYSDWCKKHGFKCIVLPQSTEALRRFLA